MRRSSAGAWRRALLVLGSLFPLATGCLQRVDDDSIAPEPTDELLGPLWYGQTHEGFVAVDTDGDGVDELSRMGSRTNSASDYNPPGTIAEISGSLPAGDVYAAFSAIQTNSTISATCEYQLSDDLPLGSARCSGVVRLRMQGTWGTDPLSFYVTARMLPLGPGAADPFSAAVEVQCDGAPAAVPIALDGTRSKVTFSGASPSSCTIEVRILDSITNKAGDTLHKVQLNVFSRDASCRWDNECPEQKKCGPYGECQLGQPGDACGSTFDCDPSSPFCNGSNACQSGDPGDPCRTAQADCRKGATCNSGLCRGPACADDFDCMPDAPICTGRGCSGRGDEGSTCYSQQDCSLALRCVYDPSIPGTVCAPGLVDGSPCVQEEDCAVGLRCLYDPTDGSLSCGEGAAEGESCFSESECRTGLRCLNRLCAVGADVGESCAVEADCDVGLRCIGATCAPPREFGERCTSFADCASGLFCTLDGFCE